MRKFVLAAVLVGALAGPTLGQQVSPEAKDAIAIAMKYMAGNYACRHIYGSTARYEAARTIATETIILAGASRDEAILFVDDMHKKFVADPRSNNNGLTDEQCSAILSETLYQLQVAQAKVRTQR